MATKKNEDCFVIMPFDECDGYDTEHFQHVYDDIIMPAVINAEFSPVRADGAKSTDLIHLSILKKLIAAPIAICDLSTRNPNVLFELGIRQAFDKPVVLIQEIGTPKIFDIAPLRYFEYPKEMKYYQVVKFQKELTMIITETKNGEAEGNINSIVRLMALSSPASIPTLDDSNKERLSLDVITSELGDLKRMIRDILPIDKNIHRGKSVVTNDYLNFCEYYKNLQRNYDEDIIPARECQHLLIWGRQISYQSNNKLEVIAMRGLMNEIRLNLDRHQECDDDLKCKK